MKYLIISIICFLKLNSISAQNPVNHDHLRKLLQEGRYVQALARIDSLETGSGDTTLLIMKGLALKGVFNYTAAARVFNQVLSHDSTQLQAMLELAGIYKQMGDLRNALTWLNRAYRLENEPAVLAEIASIWFLSEEFETAKSYYFQLLEADPGNPVFIKNIARCYDRMELTDSAIVYYEKTVEASLTDYVTLIRLCNLYIKKDLYPEGIALTDRYMALDSLNRKVNRLNAYMVILNKDYPTARERFQKCMNQQDTSGFVYKYFGIACLKLESPDTARIFLEKAYMQDSTDSQLCYYLGRACNQLFSYDLGVKYFNRTIKIVNPSPVYLCGVYQFLAESYNGQYRRQDALTALLKAYDLQTGDTLLLFNIGNQYDIYMDDKEMALKFYTEFMQTRPAPKKLPATPSGATEYSYYNAVERRIAEIKKSIGKKE
jgi:tetratricopeptide (TPR) repeat protein